MPNIISEIEQSLNEVPPLKIDIKPVMQTAPAPDPLSGVQPVSIPQAAPPPIPQPQPSAPIQPVTSTGSPVPEVPQVDALSYGDTVSRMSAQSAAEIQKSIQSAGAPKPNEIQKQLLSPSTPVQIDPKLSSQANPFAGNKPESAQERLAFEPPILGNGLANPFSDPNARAAIAAGISKEEYLAYVRDLRAKGDESNTFGTPITPSQGYIDEYGQVQGKTDNTVGSFTGLTAEQIRRKMAERSGYLSARRNFNMSFLPFSGSENRNELETLFAALSFPANLVKGIGLDVGRGISSILSGNNSSGVSIPSNPADAIISAITSPAALARQSVFNVDQIKRDYEAMRPTRGGTFTGAAVLGEQFNSMAVIDQKGAPYNPLAVVRDDSNVFQAILGFGLDVISDPLNNDKVAQLLFKPVGLFQKARVPEVPASPLSKEIVPVVTEKYRQTPTRLATTVDTPPVRPQPDGVPTPPRTVDTSIVIEREVARTNELATYQPAERVFPEPREPFTPVPDSRAIVPVPEVNMYNNVTALFNDSKELSVVQRFMRDVVEQKPINNLPDWVNDNLKVVADTTDEILTKKIIALSQTKTAKEVARELGLYVDAEKRVLDTERVRSIRAYYGIVSLDEVIQNPVLREVAEFARTGDLTPNIAVLQGAPPSDVAAIVADKLALVQEQPLVVPKLVQAPIEVPRLEFDVTRQLPKQSPVRAEKPLYPSVRVSMDSISTPIPKTFDSELVDTLARQMVDASDSVRPILVERVSPVEFKVLGGELQYAAAARAIEINPDFELRSVIVEKGTPAYDAVLRQERAYSEVSKLSEDAILERTSKDTPTYLGSKSEQKLRTEVGTRTLDIETVTTQRGGAYSEQAVNRMAESFLETGGNIRPIVVRRTSPVDFEVIRGNLEYLAAKRASEIDPQFTGVRAYIVDPKNEAAILRQLDILDEGIPVSTAKPVVVSDPPFTSLSDLMDDARDGGITSLSEVRNWTQKGDFITPLKDIPNAVDDLGIDALNTPSLMRVVKARVGGLKDKAVKEVAQSLVKVELKSAEDIAKSLFNALWRKSTDEQKQLILSTISVKRLNELGLERTVTEVVPPSLPTLSHVRASAIDESVVSEYHVVNDSQARIEDLRVTALLEQGVPRRQAIGMRDHPLMSDIMILQKMRDKYFDSFMKSKELSVASPAERAWSSAMLKRMWEVASPKQKVRIMSDIDAHTLEQLGFERITRSNVIDDHLPIETEFDTPC